MLARTGRELEPMPVEILQESSLWAAQQKVQGVSRRGVLVVDGRSGFSLKEPQQKIRRLRSLRGVHVQNNYCRGVAREN